MIIQNRQTLREIQQVFQEKFPYLQLQFYTAAHTPGEGSPNREKLNPDATVGQVRTKRNGGELSINANQKISTLEQRFAEQYGLHAQVFRKSGNLWLQTSKTDHWTLAEANGKGQRSELAFQEKYEH